MLDALDHAVKLWTVDLSHRHDVLGILTRSMFINDVWYDAVLENLVDDPGVELHPNATRQCLMFDNRVVVRLKLARRQRPPAQQQNEEIGSVAKPVTSC